MGVVADAVDDGHTAVFGERFDLFRGESAHDQRGNAVALEHGGSVADALAARKLRFAFGEKKKISAQLADAHFERDARAGGNVAEQKRDRLMFQKSGIFSRAVLCFERLGGVQIFENVLCGQPGKVDQVGRRHLKFR